MAIDIAEWMSTSEAARYLGLSRQRVDQLARSGAIDADIVAGRRLIQRRILDAWKEGKNYRGEWHPRTLRELRFKRAEILSSAAARGLSNVRVFGSIASDTAGPKSDVDLLVTLGQSASAADVAEFAAALEDSLGCGVDVIVDSDTSSALERIRAAAVPL